MLFISTIRVNVLLPAPEYEQQRHITNQDGADCVLARRRELVDSATQMMVADELYNANPWVDLPEQELLPGLKIFPVFDVQQTSDEDFCRQVFRMMKMDASVPVDSRVFDKICAAQKKRAHGSEEARRSVVHPKSWCSDDAGNSGRSRATRVPPQGRKKNVL